MRARFIALAPFVLTAVAACNAILGNEPRTLYAGDAAGGAADVGAGEGASGGDAAPADAPDAVTGDTATAADAPPEGPAPPSDGSCADASSDSKNCGTCGHSCLGAPCVGGVCQPTTLVAGIDAPRAMVADDATLWWTSGSTIYSCGKAGCGGTPAKQVTPLLGSAYSLAQDTQHLLFTDTAAQPDGGVTGAIDMWTKYSQTPPAALTLQAYKPRSIIACGSAFCWLDIPPGGPAANVYACPTSSCSPTPVTSDPGAVTIASDGQVVFIATASSIDTCPLTGCGSPSPLVSTIGPELMATAGGKLVWSENQDSVRVCTLPACTSTSATLAKNVAWPHGIVIDGANVYYTTYAAGGALYRTALAPGTTPTALANDLPTPDLVVVDATRVWFTTTGGPVASAGEIQWVAK